jgi:hypothetical protein
MIEISVAALVALIALCVAGWVVAIWVFTTLRATKWEIGRMDNTITHLKSMLTMVCQGNALHQERARANNR